MVAVIATPPPIARLTIERAEGLRIAGWAVSADGGAAALRLTADGTELRTTVRRIERADVSAALGLPASMPYGFEIDLPASVWRHVDDEGRLSMHVTTDELTKPLSSTMRVELLDAWFDAVDSTSGAPFGDAIERAAHLEAVPRSAWWARLSLDESTRSALLVRWNARQAVANAAGPRSPPAAPRRSIRGRVEAVDGLTIKGWALGSGADERFSLVCAGELVDCQVVRVERDDVRRATGSGRLALGFEIEPDGWFWRLVPDAHSAEIRVLVDGVEIESPIAMLSKDAVQDAVRRLRSDVFDPSSASEQARADRQFRELWLLEHVAGAAVLETLDRDDARFVVALAERFGLSSTLANDRQPADPGAAAAVDPLAVPTLWRLLRLTNEALAVRGNSLIDAAEHALLATGVQGIQRDRFLATLVPFFCDEGRLDEFLSWLAPAAIAEMAAAEGRWELSIAVAVRAAQSDFTAVAEILGRLQRTAAEDWLNTGCLHDATRRMLTAAAQARVSCALLEAALASLLRLIDGMVGDPGSRLHDRHLLSLTSDIVAKSAHLDATLAQSAAALVLRAYGLVPEFWRSIEKRSGAPSSGSVEVDAARPHFEAVFDAVRRCDELSPAEFFRTALHLQRFRAWRNPDADVVLRLLMVAAVKRRPAWHEEDEATLRAVMRLLPEADSIRLAAMPLAADHPLRAPQPDLLDVLRRASGVPLNANRALEVEAMAAQRALWTAVRDHAGPAVVSERFRTLRALAITLITRRDDFVGVDLLTTGALLARDVLPDDTGVLEDFRAAVNEAIGELALRRDEPLPAAMTVALSRLQRRRRGSPSDQALTDLVDDLHRAIEHRMPSDDEPPEDALVLAQPDRLHSTLVAVYSCRAHLATRVTGIRTTWGDRLRAEGVVCIVVTGGAKDAPLLDGDVLSLPVGDDYESLPQKTIALIEWVVGKTDFEHLLKIDDDCHLQVERFLSSTSHIRQHYVGRPLRRGEGDSDRLWHQKRSASARGRFAIDKSLEPSVYADGAAGYTLSRFAMHRALESLKSVAGAKRARGAFFEDKLLGDLLALQGIVVRGDEHHVYIRRRFREEAVAVGAFENTFFPGVHSPTLVTHLDEESARWRVAALSAGVGLQPSKLWPTFSAPKIGDAPGINQLELLSPLERLETVESARVVVVAVIRNEKTMLPHFLEHYRGMGVRQFVFVDNLSDDGSRELLLGEADVVTYSADTPYRESRYGVAWQESVMGHHRLGKWTLLADVDEFLTDEFGNVGSIDAVVDSLDSEMAEAAKIGMIDMYPRAQLAAADLDLHRPFDACGYREAFPLIEWRLGSGAFSNSTSWLSALRHRLLPDSAPNYYTSQKVALLRYRPWVRLSEGLHYATGLEVSARALAFAHFKYHSQFQAKVLEEVRRKQHFGDAQEYVKYRGLLQKATSALYDPVSSRRFIPGDRLLPTDTAL